MTQEHIARLMEDERLSIDELVVSCTVTREWVIEHVEAGVLLADPGPDPALWSFSGRDLQRTRRLFDLERTFEATPELAGLVADMFDELDRLRARLRRAGMPIE